MNWDDVKVKLTSRKMWLAICEFVSMLVVAMGNTAETATRVCALIMAGAGVIAYIIGEGLVDAAATKIEVVTDDEPSSDMDEGNT